MLSLTGTMAVGMSIIRGRSEDYGLNVFVARDHFGCNSEAITTDDDCRAADRGRSPEAASNERVGGPTRISLCRERVWARESPGV